jgi:hypothetical protein
MEKANQTGREAMKNKNYQLGGILFMVAAFIMILDGFFGKRTVFTVIGCSFFIIGLGSLSRSRKKNRAINGCFRFQVLQQCPQKDGYEQILGAIKI